MRTSAWARHALVAWALLALVACAHASPPAPAPPSGPLAVALAPDPHGRSPEIVELERITVEAGGGPTIDPARHPPTPLQEGWDPANVWIDHFTQRGADITLVGQGLSQADVAQLVTRLAISALFDRVELRHGEPGFDPERGDHGTAIFKFEIHLISRNPAPPKEPISDPGW